MRKSHGEKSRLSGYVKHINRDGSSEVSTAHVCLSALPSTVNAVNVRVFFHAFDTDPGSQPKALEENTPKASLGSA